MENFKDIHKKISEKYDDKIRRFASPLISHFNISHFNHFMIDNSGKYANIGLNREWEECYYAENLYRNVPFFHHPQYFHSGVILTKSIKDKPLENLINLKIKRFKINYCLQIRIKTKNGFEDFGFALNSSDPILESKLYSEIGLLKIFIKRFKEEFHSYYAKLEDYKSDIASLIGPSFYQPPLYLKCQAAARNEFMKALGLDTQVAMSLSEREHQVIRCLLKGYTAAEIGDELFISTRTAEHHLPILRRS